MSRTQAVSYGHRSFWAYDVALGILLKHMIDAAKAKAEPGESSWLAKQLEFWPQVAVLGGDAYGLCICRKWSRNQIAIFVDLIRSACRALSIHQSISAEEVAGWSMQVGDIGMDTRGAKEVRTAPVIELGEAIIALLDGTLEAAPRGTWWYFGLPDSRSTIPMSVSEQHEYDCSGCG